MTVQRRQGLFLLRFAGVVGALIALFQLWQSPFAWGYLYPISWSAARLLEASGVAVVLEATATGLCTLEVTNHVFGVEFECTGLYSLFVYLGAVLAYPATWRRRGWGVLAGVPAFAVYATLRLVALGWIDLQAPSWIEWSHIYLMVLLNLGFFLCLWTGWVQRCAEASTRP